MERAAADGDEKQPLDVETEAELPSAIEDALRATEASERAVRVHDRRGKLIFEYDPVADRAVLHVDGDLVVNVPEGKLELAARDGVVLRSERDIRLDARRELRITAGRVLEAADAIETRARRIVERARDAYREVERLSQHRAGTLRWVAKKTAELVGEDTVLKAREKMKIRGKKIHLA
jgi:hypothetical protein